MSEQAEIRSAGIIWRNQPAEEVAVDLQQIVNRRTKELDSSTRWEIVMSICAALLLVAVLLLRMEPFRDGLLGIGLAVAGIWAMLSLYLFRRQIWVRESSGPDTVAAAGLEFYRNRLERRRDHLKNAWIWHGPVVLALLALVVIATGKLSMGFERLGSAVPLVVLLVVWTAFGVVLRIRRARALQLEIDEIERGR